MVVLSLFISCQKEMQLSSVDPVNWKKRTVGYALNDSLTRGATYLSVYSQIYSLTEEGTHDLTVTVSMRNMNAKDSVFIDNAEYFDTHGESIRVYFDRTIYIAPMETVEIVIDERDMSGGTGANFMFNWRMNPESCEPFFEAVMIATSGQTGLAFTTQGKRLY